MIPGIVEGRSVHFVVPESPVTDNCRFRHPGAHVAGIICKVWEREYGCVNLRLFLDSSNDAENWQEMEWQTSVMHDPTGKKERSWHFIEREE